MRAITVPECFDIARKATEAPARGADHCPDKMGEWCGRCACAWAATELYDALELPSGIMDGDLQYAAFTVKETFASRSERDARLLSLADEMEAEESE